MKKERKVNDQEIKKLKDHISEMSYGIKNLGERIDSQEQDSRQYCLLINGVKDDIDKLAIQLRDDLEVDVDMQIESIELAVLETQMVKRD